jgi:hypothetical protein
VALFVHAMGLVLGAAVIHGRTRLRHSGLAKLQANVTALKVGWRG